MYVLYNVALSIGFLLALPVYLWRGRATGKYLRTFRDRRGRVPAGIGGARPSIWVHAVSVGEVLAARPLVAALAARLPTHPIYVSTTTVTGNAVARQGLPGAAGLFFAPFDFPGPVRRALDAVRPELLVLVETELWPNLIHETRRRGARVALINGRISPRSFPRYLWLRPFFRRLLPELDLMLMQGEPHAQRLRAMGAPPDRVRVSGNLKFDVLSPPAPSAGLRQAFAALGDRPLVVAGSTVEGEEALVIQAFREVQARVPRARLAIAPRRPERFGPAAALVEAAGLRAQRRTQLGDRSWDGEGVLVLDTLGELASAYAFASVVFVGGSLLPAGGHNILEAAIAERPVIVGPHMENFQEIADAFRAAGALSVVDSAPALAGELIALLADPARRSELGRRGRELIEAHRGALEATVDALAALVA